MRLGKKINIYINWVKAKIQSQILKEMTQSRANELIFVIFKELLDESGLVYFFFIFFYSLIIKVLISSFITLEKPDFLNMR